MLTHVLKLKNKWPYVQKPLRISIAKITWDCGQFTYIIGPQPCAKGVLAGAFAVADLNVEDSVLKEHGQDQRLLGCAFGAVSDQKGSFLLREQKQIGNIQMIFDLNHFHRTGLPALSTAKIQIQSALTALVFELIRSPSPHFCFLIKLIKWQP